MSYYAMRACFLGNWAEGLEGLIAAGLDVRLAFVGGSPSRRLDELCANQNIRQIPIETRGDIKAYLAGHSAGIDMTVISSFGLILDYELLDMLGTIINVHPGDVEAVRGRHPLPWTILKGLPYMAITFHLIDSTEVDAGPILAKVFMPINYEVSYAENEGRLRENIAPVVTQLLSARVSGRPFFTLPWTPESGSYQPPLDKRKLQEVLQVRRLMELFW